MTFSCQNVVTKQNHRKFVTILSNFFLVIPKYNHVVLINFDSYFQFVNDSGGVTYQLILVSIKENDESS